MSQLERGFAERYGPWAVVVGASEGIGRAFALALAEQTVNLVLVARRDGPLGAFARELETRFSVQARTVLADAGAADLLDRIAEATRDIEVGLVVYNAALSIVGPFLQTQLEDHLSAIDVNCRGPLAMTHAYGRKMAERGRGGIILLSSLSGLQGTALVATYAATKAFDLVLAEGVADELSTQGVDVMACVAGATRTPTFERSNPRDAGALARPMDADVVAREALAALGKTRTFFPGRVNRVAAIAMRLLPRARASKIISNATRRMYER